MEIKSNKGNKINIKDNTKITKGKLFIVVLDSEYNIITNKDETKSLYEFKLNSKLFAVANKFNKIKIMTSVNFIFYKLTEVITILT